MAAETRTREEHKAEQKAFDEASRKASWESTRKMSMESVESMGSVQKQSLGGAYKLQHVVIIYWYEPANVRCV